MTAEQKQRKIVKMRMRRKMDLSRLATRRQGGPHQHRQDQQPQKLNLQQPKHLKEQLLKILEQYCHLVMKMMKPIRKIEDMHE
jgi:hypothetical protein